jgi:hypothetical protein
LDHSRNYSGTQLGVEESLNVVIGISTHFGTDRKISDNHPSRPVAVQSPNVQFLCWEFAALIFRRLEVLKHHLQN